MILLSISLIWVYRHSYYSTASIQKQFFYLNLCEKRKLQVGSGDRSERIRTYNYPQGRVTDHRINLTLYKLDDVVSGDALGEIVDALITEDQAQKLAELG